ncbi:MAG TPA: hypothetical protein DHW61_10320 [Lachnoclostridium phytofermentans]|uniref:Uncharacterized protein n=1 Tax=Lachnoclostridium phytofermentans TaxID=66219 RepID=A0A3D2X7R8_9FIRM|nr:hypothetical protein [Lachnoclostridium sp.]HCL02787.1 hypothetical protein [Lachnoclostridium phytofermentans]
MKISILLEELINIAQISKTDFAIGLNMTPSGLSKILTGRRLPLFREKRAFCKQAANYFAETIYCLGCYSKFANLFPVIYDFSSKYELEMYLAYAIEYAFDKDLSIENDMNLDYPDREICFLGKKTILNMFCIIISDSIMNDINIPLEFYSTLPLFNKLYSDIFRRIKIINSKKQKNIIFSHFFDMSSLETSYDEYDIEFLLTIVKAQLYADLNLWKITKEIDSIFLLLKGQFLLLFSTQLDGSPLMTLIIHKSYLTVFFNSLMKKDAIKISYNRSEATAALEANPSLIDKLTNRNINAVYNFISIGYLIKKKDLESVESKESIKNSILKLFNDILIKETTFFVTIDAMMAIYATGKAIVPLIGTVDIAPDELISYLKRFETYINEKSKDKIRIVNSELPKVAVLCSSGLSLIYLIDHQYGSEKIHYFETDMINNILNSEVAESTKSILDFSPDLWSTYIDALSKNKIS